MRLLSLATLALCFLYGCGAESESVAQQQDSPAKVRTALITSADHQTWTLSGTVQSRNEADLGFRLAGQINERLVLAGQHVEAGDVLMRLDPADIRQQQSAAQAALQSARVQAENAEANRRRLDTLRARDLIPQQTYEDARAAASAASENVKSAQAQLAQARSASGYVELKAPASGLLLEVSGEVGQVVSAGMSVARLAYDGPRDVEVYVPERRRSELPTTARVQLYSRDQQADATLREISGSADPLTRSWRARYAIEGDPQAWALGSSVTLELVQAVNGQALQQVPIAALIDRGQGMGVWVVKDGQVQFTPVTLLRMDTEQAYIHSDLPADTRIVALGAHLLEAGQAVEVMP